MTMQLRRLLLLGIPACGSNTPNQGPVEPSHALPVAALGERPQPEPVASPPAATFDAKTCKIDQVPQSICGYYDDTCEVGPLRTDSTIWRNQIANEWNTKGWLLDPETTKVWQEREHAQCPGCIITHTCCLSVCVSLDVGDAPPLSPKPIPPPGWHGDMWKEEWCLLKPPNGTSAPSPMSPACPTGVTLGDERRPLIKASDTECCYQGWVKKYNPGGRPARVDGTPQFADVESGDAWHVPTPCVSRDETRAAKWLAQARMEHASVAAFATTSLRLLALGAPPALIEGAHHAAMDEIRHAQIAFSLASKYADMPLAAARFPAAATMTANVSLVELALETFVDGCIGETIGALVAAQDAETETETNPALAAMLRAIARDEARHAALGWQIVSWCVQREPAIVKLLAVVLGLRAGSWCASPPPARTQT